MYWMALPNDEKVKLSSRSAAVGRCISTKALGSKERSDITREYKYAEGNVQHKRLSGHSLGVTVVQNKNWLCIMAKP